MSTLKVNTLTDTAATKSVPIEDVVNGTARAWVNFNGTGTVAIRAQYNVSSITDGGTGKYTVNFTTAMPDANYSFQMHCIAQSSGDRTVIAAGSADSIAPTASALNFNTLISTSATLADPNFVSVSIFR